MSVTRVGATKQYSDNWEEIFGGRGSRSTANQPVKAVSPKSSNKKSTKVKSGQKRGRKQAR